MTERSEVQAARHGGDARSEAAPMTAALGFIHQALFYDSPEQFVASVLPFLFDGLNRRDAVLAVTTSTNIRALERSLGADADQVEFVESTSWYDAPGRTLAAYHRYVQERRDKYDRIWVIGEPVWDDRDTVETAEWTRYESVFNVTFAGMPASVICLYDRRALPPAIIADALRTHPRITTVDGSTPSTGYADPAHFWVERNSTLPPPASGYASLAFVDDPRPVRWFVAAYAAELSLPANRIDDLIIAVNEIATNAIKHGAGYGEVRLWREGQRLLCEISDPGYVEEQFLGYLPGNPDADHGHGLWLSRQLTDLMEVRNGLLGTTIRLHMRLGLVER